MRNTTTLYIARFDHKDNLSVEAVDVYYDHQPQPTAVRSRNWDANRLVVDDGVLRCVPGIGRRLSFSYTECQSSPYLARHPEELLRKLRKLVDDPPVRASSFPGPRQWARRREVISSLDLGRLIKWLEFSNPANFRRKKTAS